MGLFMDISMNHFFHCHKTFCEALYKLQELAFLDSLAIELKEEYVITITKAKDSLPSSFSNMLNDDKFKSIISHFDSWVEERCNEDATFQHAVDEIPFPGWTAFNILILRQGLPIKTRDRFGYLRIIDDPVTDIDVVKFISDKS